MWENWNALMGHIYTMSELILGEKLSSQGTVTYMLPKSAVSLNTLLSNNLANTTPSYIKVSRNCLWYFKELTF